MKWIMKLRVKKVIWTVNWKDNSNWKSKVKCKKK